MEQSTMAMAFHRAGGDHRQQTQRRVVETFHIAMMTASNDGQGKGFLEKTNQLMVTSIMFPTKRKYPGWHHGEINPVRLDGRQSHSTGGYTKDSYKHQQGNGKFKNQQLRSIGFRKTRATGFPGDSAEYRKQMPQRSMVRKNILFHLLDNLKEELQRMEQLEIIKPVTEPTK
ncbi:hypothetical protein PR048_022986 [Dryococelus australis]|uniref:Uncharacterized protein n=1 Tax=Dryococelus australis TaxID=614101 RepID=A0ABQ9GST4_9NEOP|nr:hypothetical protein PR048_022986 [Dryococelus australis]